MIKFLSNIRKSIVLSASPAFSNRACRYLLYAIGEIILVVIGILIALQVNTWNENRKKLMEERALISNMIEDLKSDSVSYTIDYQILMDIKAIHIQLYRIGVKKESDVYIDNPNNIRTMLWYNPITKDNDPMIASRISNDLIRKEILIFFRNMKDMQAVYDELYDVVIKRIRVYLGKKEVHDLSDWFENGRIVLGANEKSINMISRENLIALANEPEFQQLLFEASVKLADNIDQLSILINQNSKLIRMLEAELKK